MENEKILRSIACIIAIDGKIERQERQFWERLCNRLNISDKDAAEILEQAKKEKKRIHIPETPAKKTLLFTLLVQAAYSDGTISQQERKVLETVAGKIGMSHDDVQHIIETNVPPTPLPASIDDVEEENPKKKVRMSSPLILTMIATLGTIFAAIITITPHFLQPQPNPTPTPTSMPTSPTEVPMVSMMVIRGIEVFHTGADDKKWDITTEPDIQVEVQNLTSGQKQVTDIQPNTFTALFNTQVFRVAENDTLQIIVYDVDRAGNDIIGKLTQRITTDMLTQQTLTWNFDHVQSLQIEFQPIHN